MVEKTYSSTASQGLRLKTQLFINKQFQMSYISHVDYKSMMENFKKGAPKQMLKESLDPVGKEDDDINNDGKVDKTDKYLSSRRQAIGKAIGKGRMMRESLPENDRWYEDFEDGLQNLAKNKYISPLELQYYMKALDHVDPMDNYSDFDGHDAAKEFVDDLRSKEDMQESGTGDESFDFNKSAIESASGDKISHTETDDYGRPIYWGTKDTNVSYFIADDGRIIKTDWTNGGIIKTIGDINQYDEPEYDYEPDTDADYEEPRDDFDMAGDFNDGEFWEGKMKEEVNPSKSYHGSTANQGATGATIDFTVIENTPEYFKIDYVITPNSGRAPMGASRSYRPEKKYGEWKISKVGDKGQPLTDYEKTQLNIKGDRFSVNGKEFVSDIYGSTGVDSLNEGANYEDPYTLAKAVALAHPELQKFALEDRKMFQRAAFKYADEFMTKAGISNTAQINLINGYADEDWPSDYISALGEELEGMQEGLNEFGGHGDTPDNPKLQAAAKYLVQNRDKFITQDYFSKHAIGFLSLKSDKELYDYIVNNMHSDSVYDTVADMESQMEEGLHMPPLQATGPTVSTNEGMHMPPLQATGNSAIEEDQAPFGMSVLSPDERKQLKEYINSYRTIKTEIAKLLSKTGKSGKIMEATVAEDEAVPAERKAKYKDPTTVPVQKHKHSNLGGDRTNLVMTKAEMWENEGHEEAEHERIESMLNTKLHDAFHKVTGMVIKDLMDGGFDEGDIKNFLQHEIEEKAKEAVNAQHDF